ncbi:MAG TPA: hypothetical protein VMI56_27555 [Reyranella sp.]|nr:hypothetical protein [Reyranella sp.]
MTLKPSLWLFLRTVLGILIALTVFGYFWQGYGEGHWWSYDYDLSLAVPLTVVPCFMWIAFVPLELTISDECLKIRYAFRRAREVRWTRLMFWGNGGEATFLLQFSGVTFQIALFAFPRDQREQLIDLLKRRFPLHRAKGWSGISGFR